MKTNSIDLGQSSDEEEGNKRGPNWKEHWIVNLIHLRGKMHDKVTGMKKQGQQFLTYIQIESYIYNIIFLDNHLVYIHCAYRTFWCGQLGRSAYSFCGCMS